MFTDRCRDLSQRIVCGTNHCAELAPYHAVLSLRTGQQQQQPAPPPPHPLQLESPPRSQAARSVGDQQQVKYLE